MKKPDDFLNDMQDPFFEFVSKVGKKPKETHMKKMDLSTDNILTEMKLLGSKIRELNFAAKDVKKYIRIITARYETISDLLNERIHADKDTFMEEDVYKMHKIITRMIKNNDENAK